MPPVLLLHEPNPPYETRRLVRVLSERVANAAAEVLWPHRFAPVAATLLRRVGGLRVIHAFGRRALALAVLSARAQVIFSPTRFPRRGDIAWVRAALRYRSLKIVCGSDAERRAWVTGGVPIDRCVLIRPGVSLAIPPDARAAARARFGYTDADRVVFTPLPSPGLARSAAVWTGCLLNVLDERTKTLGWTPDGVAGEDELNSLRTRLIAPAAFTVFADAEPAAGFVAADVVLLPPADFVPPTVVAMAMASGRPIVARTTAQVCEMIEDRHTALLTRDGTSKVLTERVEDAFADAGRSRQVADQARAEAYEYFLLSRMIADYRTLYAAAETNSPTDADLAAAP